MDNPAQREQQWQALAPDTTWDLIIVGGGIVGAAVLREAVRSKLKVLLLEQGDFSSGTSSRSSKMVHGGLRYIASGDFTITRDSVRERERLMHEAPGLIEPMGYLFASRKKQYPGRWLFTALLTIYDVFAGKRDHRFLSKDEALMQAPQWNDKDLKGACQYTDAATDDARLVLRLIQEAQAAGGVALNYCAVQELGKESGQVCGVIAKDVETGRTLELKARAVVNATGAWADKLRAQVVNETKMRPLRGSHLVFAAWALPVAQSITFMHPQDKRPVFIFPWEGTTVVGTTDLDHPDDLALEPKITQQEVDYLFTALNSQFPGVTLKPVDVLATWAGVRPVIGTGALNPSKEKREHCVWDEHGLITVTGGKLTTFRIIALDTLKSAEHYLPDTNVGAARQVSDDGRIFSSTSAPASFTFLLAADQRRRLLGRYGSEIVKWLEDDAPENLAAIPGTQTLWSELRWAAAKESVVHLDDLLLRRTRIGLLLANGGVGYLPRIRSLCQPLLGWSDDQWDQEQVRYIQLWQSYYSMPAPEL
jgi:glycerol-3-phosphate dehydrogenase